MCVFTKRPFLPNIPIHALEEVGDFIRDNGQRHINARKSMFGHKIPDRAPALAWQERQDRRARFVDLWVAMIGLVPSKYGIQTLRQTRILGVQSFGGRPVRRATIAVR